MAYDKDVKKNSEFFASKTKINYTQSTAALSNPFATRHMWRMAI
jgi:hypothetical protein